MLVGKIIYLRVEDDELIAADICDEISEQDLDNKVYHIEMPVIVAALIAHNAGKQSFDLVVHSYEIISLELSIEPRPPDPEPIDIDKDAVIHLVTRKSFGSIHYCCPNCQTTDNDDIKIISVNIKSVLVANKYFKLAGVLNCKKCDYFYADKMLFNNFLKVCDYDVLVPRKEIKVRNNTIVPGRWHGAPDSVLSRYGYSADGSTPEHVRRTIISNLISNKNATHFEIQNLLSGFIYGREERNHNAAIIWRSDLEWLNSNYGSTGTVTGIIS